MRLSLVMGELADVKKARTKKKKSNKGVVKKGKQQDGLKDN